MPFNSIYQNFDTQLTQYLKEKKISEVPFVKQDSPQLISLNEFVLRTEPFNFYSISHDPLSILKNILSLNDSTIARFETFLNNIGPVFINDFSVETFNERQNLINVFIGVNASKNQFFAISFKKHDFHLHVTEAGMKFSAHYDDLTTPTRHSSGDFNVDFELALDDFIVLINSLTGVTVNSEFKSKLESLTTTYRINTLLSSKNVSDVTYIDQGVNNLSFYKENAQELLIVLEQLFSKETYETLVKIVTAVTNYQKARGSTDKFSLNFPVKNIFYDISKLPFIYLYLNEKYQIGFSVNGFSFTNNAIVHHVPDYKRLPSVLATILEERSRVVDMDRLTAPLT